MAWRDRLQPASFRGVPFEVESTQGNFGRRMVVHEYPQRDIPFSEDLGRSARTFTIVGFVLEPEYIRKRDDLLNAIESPNGPGELVHPFLGSMLVTVVDFSINESWQQGGQATFTLKCREAGQRSFPSPQEDTADVVQTRASAAIQSSRQHFTTRFATTGHPDFINTEAQIVVGEGLTAMDEARGS